MTIGTPLRIVEFWTPWCGPCCVKDLEGTILQFLSMWWLENCISTLDPGSVFSIYTKTCFSWLLIKSRCFELTGSSRGFNESRMMNLGNRLKKMVTNRSFSIAGLKIEFRAGIRSFEFGRSYNSFLCPILLPITFFDDVDGFNLKAYKITVSLESMTWFTSAIERRRLYCLFYSSLENFEARGKYKEST